MVRISAADQVLLLLREQLDRAERKKDTPASDAPPVSNRARMVALAQTASLDERTFRRTLVRGLLADRLGKSLAAEPAFETIVGEVLRSVEESPEAAALLDAAAVELGWPIQPSGGAEAGLS